jgi:hypothetical protein
MNRESCGWKSSWITGKWWGKQWMGQISLFHRVFQFTMCNGPTNALVCNKTLIQMSQIKTLKITPTCFDHQLIIIGELLILVKITG